VFFQSQDKLIKQAQQGDQAAWLKLIKQHEQQVYNHCLRLTGNSHDALDLMQEAFMSVYRSLHNFHGQSQFKTWLFSVTQARCMDFFRKQRQSSPLEEVSEAAHTPSCPIQLQSDNQHIHAALQALPFEQRQIVELKFFQHFTFEEIAEQLAISPNTVKSRLYSALGKMKAPLEVIRVES
jgi:RNA polymerase sigma-70 factor (ECF subfamily)